MLTIALGIVLAYVILAGLAALWDDLGAHGPGPEPGKPHSKAGKVLEYAATAFLVVIFGGTFMRWLIG